jgi:transposase
MNRPVPITLGQRAIFIPHSGRAKSTLNRLDQFAEYLAEGYSVPDAARMVGVGPAYGNSLLQRIRKRLGPQAK